ncbi:MAG: glycoside hydrolase family 20 zincin-like fold domain-containing protein [Blastocatellia bacterium]
MHLPRPVYSLFLSLFLLSCHFSCPAHAQANAGIDLTRAVVVAPADFSGPENKAVQMLIEEIERRSQIRWAHVTQAHANAPAIVLARGGAMPREGYQIKTAGNVITITGADARGVLYGAGHLLRTLRLAPGAITLPSPLNLTTAPQYPLRGHQLGYRPKTNSYDGWDVAAWEQYIRDLVVWGTNAIELIPPRSDDDADSPHFPLPPMRMMIEMSRICAEYGLDVWIWYPALDKDYGDPKTVEFALHEWGEVFRQLPRVDAVFVPGGDPGATPPRLLMNLLEKQTANLRRYHPRAGMWVAPQGFSREWMDEFMGMVRAEPQWLSGIVYGPQSRLTLPQMRAAVPARYPIRHYPDITHSRQSQFAVPDWDLAYALTEAREVINPRPLDQAHIFRLLQPQTNGFIAYSEGCNDDVNKIIWSALGWNPDTDVRDILRAYSRYFIGPAYEDSFARGLLALEQNWRGPVITNHGIETTLRQFQTMEHGASPRLLQNWRFQQALYRANYDAYVRGRAIYETSLEEQAMGQLREARALGSSVAMSEAEQILDQALTRPVARDLRARVFELGEALFQSIHMQLSVEKYRAIAVGRGANLNTIDFPLNNRLWLKQRFAEIRRLDNEAERQKHIAEIVDWTNPGPGGFYDDLGNLTRQPHLLRGPGFEKDPYLLESSVVSMVGAFDGGAVARRDEFALTGMGFQPYGRMSWWDIAETYYDTPLQMRYTGLDPGAQYKARIVYSSATQQIPIRLVAHDNIEIHPLLKKELHPVEFDIPAAATAAGELLLTWTQAPGSRGAGRGCQVAEVWLIKKQTVESRR